jgi:hypothetical protein
MLAGGLPRTSRLPVRKSAATADYTDEIRLKVKHCLSDQLIDLFPERVAQFADRLNIQQLDEGGDSGKTSRLQD